MLTRIFGLSLMPAVFEVVTRVLKVAITILIDGEAKMHVDDIMGASASKFWMAHRHKAVEEAKMLGKKAEAVDKRYSSDDNKGRIMDYL